jgi:hypothetical protein
MLERLKAWRKLNREWKEYRKNPQPGGPNVKSEMPGAPWKPKGGERVFPSADRYDPKPGR